MRLRTFLAAALLATSAFVSVAPGGAPMGFPGAYLGEGQWAVGAEYGYERTNLRAFGAVTEEFLAGSSHTWNSAFQIDDLTSHMGFGTLAYGISDTWDIFARVGAANARDTLFVRPADTDALQAQDNFDGSFGFAWGVGTRATFLRSGPWSVGGLVQVTWFYPGESNFAVPNPDPAESWGGEVKLKYWQAQTSLAAGYQADRWRVWAGPFLQFIRGDMDFRSTDAGVGVNSIRWSSKVQEDAHVGGHAGLACEVSDQFNLWVEGQVTGSDSWLVGVGAVFIPGKGSDL